MTYDPDKHHRRNIRLKGYDYSREGLYYVTLCTQNHVCMFGKIDDGKMILNNVGQMVENEWLKLAERFENIVLHKYVVMPNYFHAILEIVGATLVVAQNGGNEQTEGQPQGIAPTVGDIVGAFVSITTVEYIRRVKSGIWRPFNKKIWQRNYWEHIIRDEKSYLNILEYIINNPENWDNDTLKMDY